MSITPQEKRFTWQDAPDLMARLTNAQNRLRTPIDIVSFAAFCESRAELERHVVRYEQQVANQKSRRAA